MDQSILELIPVDGSRYGDGRVLVVEQLQEAHDEKDTRASCFGAPYLEIDNVSPDVGGLSSLAARRYTGDQRLRRHGGQTKLFV
jgi:hypothetical protein